MSRPPAAPVRAPHRLDRRARAALGLALALGLAPAAAADGPLRQELVARYTGPEVVAKLRQGGHVVLMRHMATVREPDDWSGVEIDDCSTQRVLSDEGRRQARELGEAFRKLAIPVGAVLVSPYCRTRESAELAFGQPGTEAEILSTWDHLAVDEKTERATALRKMLDTPPASGTNTVLISHTGNLLWSLGLDSKPEGLAHVFTPTGLSIARPTYLGRVDPDEWRALAGLTDGPEPSEGDVAAGEGDVAAPAGSDADAAPAE
jgi:phosphohistidine phosphatase SixA